MGREIVSGTLGQRYCLPRDSWWLPHDRAGADLRKVECHFESQFVVRCAIREEWTLPRWRRSKIPAKILDWRGQLALEQVPEPPTLQLETERDQRN